MLHVAFNAKIESALYIHNSAIEKMSKVVFRIKYERSNFDTNKPDPSPAELEKYVSTSQYILDNPSYHIDGIIGAVSYIGDMSFEFTCCSELSADELASLLADSLIRQNLADGEWEACPGHGSFVYPTDESEDAEELGLLSYDTVTVSYNTPL